ncbi:hypothetical protein TNCV_124431 [Trichonephila clavipes]|nr:hypothetical protein TNCV_124431 [Trichonephila clavipes]
MSLIAPALTDAHEKRSPPYDSDRSKTCSALYNASPDYNSKNTLSFRNVTGKKLCVPAKSTGVENRLWY